MFKPSYQACVFGHMLTNLDGGQTIKTLTLVNELEKCLGNDELVKIDTSGGIKRVVFLLVDLFKYMRKSANVIVLPGQNGLRIIAPMISFFNLFFHRRIHYIVIGGWLPQFLIKRKSLSAILRKFDGIYVETNSMKNALEAQEFANVIVMPNCKNVDILTEEELVYASAEPLKVCTFSRVIKEKGIEDAIHAVNAANNKIGKIAYCLDIYGEVGELQREWFRTIEKNFGEQIVYKGFLDSNRSVEVLKNYYALLFPTYYEGEGFAGTIIDAFASGVPVVASDWKYNSEIIEDGCDGVIIPARNVCALADKLVEIYENMDLWNAMKPNCLNRAREYLSENVIKVLMERLY